MGVEDILSVRGIVKAITYRILATISTFFISWILTGHWIVASSIALLEIVINTVIFYFHERAWKKIRWFKKKDVNSQIFK